MNTQISYFLLLLSIYFYYFFSPTHTRTRFWCSHRIYVAELHLLLLAPFSGPPWFHNPEQQSHSTESRLEKSMPCKATAAKMSVHLMSPACRPCLGPPERCGRTGACMCRQCSRLTAGCCSSKNRGNVVRQTSLCAL